MTTNNQNEEEKEKKNIKEGVNFYGSHTATNWSCQLRREEKKNIKIDKIFNQPWQMFENATYLSTYQTNRRTFVFLSFFLVFDSKST